MTMPAQSQLSRLDGRVALVTGGTRGLGLATARLLVTNGAEVFVVGRDAVVGQAAADNLGATFVQQDLLAERAAHALMVRLTAQAGRLDIVVNNAGSLGAPENVRQTTRAALLDTLGLHLVAPWEIMNEALPLLKRSSCASIINIASVAGHRVGATSAAYSAAKAALIHLTRLAAAEFGEFGIRVNSVSPGFIPTAIHAQALAEGDGRRDKFVAGLARLFRTRQALDRTGTDGDVAELVAFLASDASGFVSGSDFVADGGMMWGRAGLL